MNKFPSIGWFSCALGFGLLQGFWVEPESSRGAEPESPKSLSGSWELSWARFGETNVDRLLLTQRVDRVTGRVFGDLNLDGSITGDQLNLKALNRDKKE